MEAVFSDYIPLMEKIVLGVLDSEVPFRDVPFLLLLAISQIGGFFLVLTTSNVLCIEVL